MHPLLEFLPPGGVLLLPTVHQKEETPGVGQGVQGGGADQQAEIITLGTGGVDPNPRAEEVR